ncbi:MAG: hypothetical protein CM15mP74_05790 [Halieaceae bacterium]|nr:MAG: hypothetical protein CM15mP74_05790 [Halieaceae bacterium]
MVVRPSCPREAWGPGAGQPRRSGDRKGNPLEDIKVLQTADNILAVMKDGQIFSGLLDPARPIRKARNN